MALIVHPHLFQHIAALGYLNRHPGAYGLMRLVLGHRSVETTTKFYCGLAEQLEGNPILKSKRGEGTTAEIWLPASETGETVPVAPRGNEAVNINPALILAVDDDPLVLMNTSFMLEDLGPTVLTAVSGKQALETLRGEQKVDLVIADQAMPGMTGTELIQEIRKQWPNLPIILATGYAQLPPGAPPEIKLAKPFGQDELARAVAEALRGQK
jgi:CheY-like chemotaxis protein